MGFFIPAYALTYLLWRADDGHSPILLLIALLIVSVWLVLYWRARGERRPH